MPDFSPQSLLAVLQRYPSTQCYWLGFSGGIDSSCLLHAMVQLKPLLLPTKIRAIYIDHGLQAESQQWSDQCKAVCESYGVAFVSQRLELTIDQGDSLEEKARESRYAVLANYIEAGDILLTAQHKDDQAETFLLQALRGAGPKGLASMPEIKAFAKGHHLRPLLGFSKPELESYAREQGLTWIEDPSNQHTRFHRNYLRQKVFPLLQEGWPGTSDALSRSAGHCAESASLLNQLAGIDMASAAQTNNTLSRSALNKLLPERRANLIRYWLGKKGLRAPDHRRLEQIITQLETSAEDKSPLITWPGAEIRCYRDSVYAMVPLVPVDETKVYRWLRDETLQLDDGQLCATLIEGGGLRVADESRVEVRFRQGGERCQPAGQTQTRELKTLFQEWQVPHWLRARIPLLYVEGELAAIAGFSVCEPYAAGKAEMGWQFDWQSTSKC